MSWFHSAGVLGGWLMYIFSPPDARRLRENLRAAGLFSSDGEYRKLLRKAIGETGKTAGEWVKVWFAPDDEIDRLAIECRGWHGVEEARRRGQAVILLLPHIGSFQFALRYLAKRLPLTALYRPPKFRWMQTVMAHGSRRSRLSMAPTNLKGVEILLRALRRGEVVALPPDQVPKSSGIAQVEFFGRPALTTTLPKKLQRASTATVFMVFAERLPSGGGFRLELSLLADEEIHEHAINRSMESLVRRCPGQYLWSYNRYKISRAAMRKARRHNGAVSVRDRTLPVDLSDR
jgi:Kdo2-lipid IVA lauroyltransferase/acyltransferase